MQHMLLLKILEKTALNIKTTPWTAHSLQNYKLGIHNRVDLMLLNQPMRQLHQPRQSFKSEMIKTAHNIKTIQWIALIKLMLQMLMLMLMLPMPQLMHHLMLPPMQPLHK